MIMPPGPNQNEVGVGSEDHPSPGQTYSDFAA